MNQKSLRNKSEVTKNEILLKNIAKNIFLNKLMLLNKENSRLNLIICLNVKLQIKSNPEKIFQMFSLNTVE
jgi:hypothetical protein